MKGQEKWQRRERRRSDKTNEESGNLKEPNRWTIIETGSSYFEIIIHRPSSETIRWKTHRNNDTGATGLPRCQILAIVRARNSKVWLNFRLVCVCRSGHAWRLHAFFIRQGIFCDVTALEFRKCPRDYS